MKDLRTIQPIQYVQENPSFESLVLTFARVEAEVRLVISYAWDYETRPKGVNEFRLLRFCDSGRFDQTEVRAMGGLVNESYQAREEEPGAFVVSRERVWSSGAGYEAEYCLSDLGCFEFEFAELRVAKKVLHVVGRDGDLWLYEDEQGRPVDFYDPFGLRL